MFTGKRIDSDGWCMVICRWRMHQDCSSIYMKSAVDLYI